jgi:hypothetical protein
MLVCYNCAPEPQISYDIGEFCYSLRPILFFANIDVSRHILVIDTSVSAMSNMGQREYNNMYLCIHVLSLENF